VAAGESISIVGEIRSQAVGAAILKSATCDDFNGIDLTWSPVNTETIDEASWIDDGQ